MSSHDELYDTRESKDEESEKYIPTTQHTSESYLSTCAEEFSNFKSLQTPSYCIKNSISQAGLCGLSETLSSESMQNVKKRNINSNFDKKQKNSEENPLCENISQSYEFSPENRDAFSALKELDTVLEVHDCTNNNMAASECDQTNIEECLLELDDYLEKMDECCFQQDISAIPKNLSCGKTCQFTRGLQLRNTISCSLEKQKPDVSLKRNQVFGTNSVYATWGKKAVRNLKDKQLGKKKRDNNENEEITTSLANNDNSASFECSANVNNEASFNSLQVLTDNQIFQNLIEQNETYETANDRPRQFGRRAERYPRLSITENNAGQNCEYNNYYNIRPMSAPIAAGISDIHAPNPILCVITDGSTARSSRNESPVSIDSSLDSVESLTNSNNYVESNQENIQQSPSMNSENMDATLNRGINTYWPYRYSRTFALISCTLGLFNISRFAVLTINYGGNFLIQFLILSVIFGIPFLWLQMCLGSKIKAGPISMWKISPICIGIGISLIFVQYFITVYSSVVIVWLLVYIGDTLMYHSSYPWSESINSMFPRLSSTYSNLTQSVPDYFNLNVLQRQQAFKIVQGNNARIHVNDRLAFYLVMMWVAVFLILCKGLKSFGKVLLLLGVLPIIVLAVITGKLLFVVDLAKLQNVFSSSEFDDFLVNPYTWTAAAQETFLTWGLLGASIISISSRTHINHTKLTLRSDAIFVVLITFIGLCLSALVGLCTIQIVNQSGYVYVPGSYENPEHYSAIYSLKSLTNSDIISYPTKFVPHYSSVIGEVYRRHANIQNISDYQVLRFVTELIPAAVAISMDNVSWIWTSIIFSTLFAFGVSQLCVMWKPISCALGNSTSAVLLSCVTGLLLSIPFATEIGIKLLHYMDILLGGAWFVPILWASEIIGIFLIRGRPYNGDDLVNDLKMSGSMSAFLALSWNVLLPIGLITLAVIEYKISLSNQLYYWRGRSFFSYWSKKVGAFTQIGFLLLVPISAVIQIFRYLTSDAPDILDRIQMLYRPLDGIEGNRTTDPANRNIWTLRYQDRNNDNLTSSGIRQLQDDAPPKYTPPPSYTTATGARLAKILRQSIRRSVRRIIGESNRSRPILSIQTEMQNQPSTYPPDYSAVLTNRSEVPNAINPIISETLEIVNRPSFSTIYGRSHSLGRKQSIHKRRLGLKNQHLSSTSRDIDFDTYSSRRSSRMTNDRPYTAQDVITILRSSTIGRNRQSRSMHPQSESIFCSVENLVLNAEPPDLSSAIVNEQANQNDQNSTSVI